ncbi:MAG: type II secretion system protein [Bacilli bacterium]
MKKMYNKGFTLIELLAVVIILAVVLLIAVPAVLNLITQTNENKFRTESIAAIAAVHDSIIMELTSPGLGGITLPTTTTEATLVKISDLTNLDNKLLNNNNSYALVYMNANGKYDMFINFSNGSYQYTEDVEANAVKDSKLGIEAIKIHKEGDIKYPANGSKVGEGDAYTVVAPAE